MDKAAKIYVAGHRGMVGSAIWRALERKGFGNLVGATHGELDLCDQSRVNAFFEREKPEYVFLAAAKVGGILANDTYRADFIYQNLAIQSNVIQAAYANGVKRLLFLGSSCIYPRDCPQPMKEEYLLTGPLEHTNEPYAIAKIAGLKMCESYNRQYGAEFISAMPTNLYGPNDNFDLESSHLVPALIRKFVEARAYAKTVVNVWGTGKPRRELMHVNDAADALIFLMNVDFNVYQEMGVSHVNIGTGEDVTISEIAGIIRDAVKYDVEVKYDESKPDGMPRKLLDVSRMSSLGWQAKIPIKRGIEQVVSWFGDAHGFQDQRKEK